MGTRTRCPQQERERYVRSYTHPDGWLQGEFSLPPSEAAGVQTGDGDRPRRRVPRRAGPRGRRRARGSSRPGVSWADAFMRLVNEGNDALDPTLAAHRLPR